ncbi:hypothetical protein [Mycobacterium marinum]|uniref:hypothetical protein n=1 Tax=Mycobacterium marinum TaxID=1781 RepID=UPI002359AE64|nr:hypothetical protein [Mycobacterium marinum]MDC9004095.1 hypothetical protein [Mycobacterium marinum]
MTNPNPVSRTWDIHIAYLVPGGWDELADRDADTLQRITGLLHRLGISFGYAAGLPVWS